MYLWGNVDRPPNNRSTLHDKQPVYYQSLGDLFCVQKKAQSIRRCKTHSAGQVGALPY
jgi:hypothetical protein